MRVLLDECVPWRFRYTLPDHDVRTVHYMGWSGLRNGELLARMINEGFEVFVTLDRHLRFQQNIRQSGIAVIEMTAPSSHLADLTPLAPLVLATLARIQPGEFVRIPIQVE